MTTFNGSLRGTTLYLLLNKYGRFLFFCENNATNIQRILQQYFLKESGNLATSAIAKTWIIIEDKIKIMNEVLDAELDIIANQDEDDVFCNDSEDENGFLIVPEE